MLLNTYIFTFEEILGLFKRLCAIIGDLFSDFGHESWFRLPRAQTSLLIKTFPLNTFSQEI